MPRGPLFQFPLAGLALILAFFALALLFAFIQVGVITVAFAKLGLTPWQGFLLIIATLLGSSVNLPLFKTGRQVPMCTPQLTALFRHVRGPAFNCPEGKLIDQQISINMGGCIIPCFLCFHLLSQGNPLLPFLLCTAIVTTACYKMAKPIQGVGIGIPFLIPPLITALTAMLLAPPEIAPHVAYVAGSLGTLLGADVLHLANRRTMNQLQAPMLSIGGAGTFDGIFITGILAVLLA